MEIQCPHCGIAGTVRDSYRNRQVRCPECSKTFKVENPDKKEATLGDVQELIVVTCPNCGAEGASDAALWGRRVRCSDCQWLFVLGQPADVVEPVDPMAELDLDSVDLEFDALGDTRTPEQEPAYASQQADSFAEMEEPGAFAEEELFDEPLLAGEYTPDEAVKAPAAAATVSAVAEESYDPADAELAAFEDEIAESATISTEAEKQADKTKWTVSWALAKALRRTRGVKLVIWMQTLLLMILGGLYGIALSPTVKNLFVFHEETVSFNTQALTPTLIATLAGTAFIFSIIKLGFIGGFTYTGVRRAAGARVSFGMLGRGFACLGKLFGAFILMTLFVSIGTCLFVLPGIYLFIAYSMTFPLIVEERLSVSQAMKKSRKAVNKVWFKVFILYILMTIILFLSSLFFGIALIWTLPMSWVLIGVVYQALFSDRVVG